MERASCTSLAPSSALVPETESSRTERAVFRFRAAMRSAEARAALATDSRESTVALLAEANCSGVVKLKAMGYLLNEFVTNLGKTVAARFHEAMLHRTMALIIGRIVRLSTLFCAVHKK